MIHPTALVAATAHLGAGVRVGPFAVIEDEVEIGDGTEVRAHAVVKRFTTLGPGNVVHEGAVLGGEPQDVSFTGTVSRLLIGPGNRIREGVTIHRSARADGATTVGSGGFLMAQSHVAHDCHLGDGVILANNVALAGHVEVGEYAILGGLAAVQQRCRVGAHAFIGGLSAVTSDIVPFVMALGHRAALAGINVRGLSVTTSGKSFAAYIGLDSVADADNAAKLLKKVGTPSRAKRR